MFQSPGANNPGNRRTPYLGNTLFLNGLSQAATCGWAQHLYQGDGYRSTGSVAVPVRPLPLCPSSAMRRIIGNPTTATSYSHLGSALYFAAILAYLRSEDSASCRSGGRRDPAAPAPASDRKLDDRPHSCLWRKHRTNYFGGLRHGSMNVADSPRYGTNTIMSKPMFCGM